MATTLLTAVVLAQERVVPKATEPQVFSGCGFVGDNSLHVVHSILGTSSTAVASFLTAEVGLVLVDATLLVTVARVEPLPAFAAGLMAADFKAVTERVVTLLRDAFWELFLTGDTGLAAFTVIASG